MGNSEQSFQVRIQDHESPIGLILSEDPLYYISSFPCLSCGRDLYDGGLCQSVECPCGLLLRRLESGDITQVRPSIPTFESQFDWCSSKGYGISTDLLELTIGVFEEEISPSISIILKYCLLYTSDAADE